MAQQKERDYSHRDVVDKLGIKPGHAVAFDQAPLPVDPALRARALEKAGRPAAADTEPVDVVLIGADASTPVDTVLAKWRQRLINMQRQHEQATQAHAHAHNPLLEQ